MDQQIDSLSLKIGVDINQEELKNLKSFTNQIRILSKSIASLDLKKLNDLKVPKGLKKFNMITQNFKNIESQTVNQSKSLSLGTVAEGTAKLQSKMKTVTKVSDDMKKIQSNVPKLQTSLNDYSSLIDKFLGTKKSKSTNKTPLGKLSVMLKRIKLIAFVKAIRGIINFVTKGLQTGVNNLAMFDKGFNKTISGIKTSITQAFNGITLIFQPIIETIEPVFQSISNSITTVANQVSKIQASMKGQATYTKINAKYAEDYAQSLQKANAFSFDTFNTLNTQSNMFESESVEELTDDDKQKQTFLKTIKEFVQTLFDTLKSVFAIIKDVWALLQPILNELLMAVNTILKPINDVIQGLMGYLEPVFKVIGEIASVLITIGTLPLKAASTWLGVVFKLLEPILDIINKVFNALEDMFNKVLTPIQELIDTIFDSVSKVLNGDFKGAAEALSSAFTNAWNGVKNGITEFFVSGLPKVFEGINDKVKTMFQWLIDLVNKLTGGKDYDEVNIGGTTFVNPSSLGNKQSGFAGYISSIHKASQENAWEFIKSIFGHANGGMVGAGEVWRMNEFGNPEMLFNAENGSQQTSVINLEQITQAFTQAIFQSGLIETIEASGGVYIDGKEIAASKNFQNEMNRRNNTNFR